MKSQFIREPHYSAEVNDIEKMTEEDKDNELYFERQPNSNDSGMPNELNDAENRYRASQFVVNSP